MFKILLSYHYFKTLDVAGVDWMAAEGPLLTIADSGAYSAATQGARLDLRDYAAWVMKWRERLFFHANLDVIGDAEGTWKNQIELEAMGLDPVPVFHTGEDWSWLERYAERYPYIALGGAVGYPAALLTPWFIECFRRARVVRPDVRFHGFGLTSIKVISALPFYTVDSSSFAYSYRLGQVVVFDEVKGKFLRAKTFDAKSIAPLASRLIAYGIDPERLVDRKKYHASYAIKVAMQTWLNFERWVRRRVGVVSAPPAVAARYPELDVNGLMLFFALNTSEVRAERREAFRDVMQVEHARIKRNKALLPRVG